MFSKVFLAGFQTNPPERFAYMSLHFSPYGKGLSNLPNGIPKRSILLLDDSHEVTSHDPRLIAQQLEELANQHSPVAILLDFQRPVSEELNEVARCINNTLACPVGVTEEYAKVLGCPVFLPPLPANKALEEYIAPWKKQGVFLEIAPVGVEFTVTEQGSQQKPIPSKIHLPLEDKRLHCHYHVRVFPEKVVFSIYRCKEDLAALVTEAENLGVLGCVGFYWELVE